MIAFDNGPADGDYVRYIDDLMKRAAVATSAGVLASSTAAGRTTGRVPDRAVAASAAPPSGIPDVWGPIGRDGLAPAARNALQPTGFAPAVAATPAATTAAAIASALMSGQMSGRPAWATRTTAGLVALAFGLVLLVLGFLAQPLNVLVIAGGGALIAWAVRWLRDAVTRPTRRSPGA